MATIMDKTASDDDETQRLIVQFAKVLMQDNAFCTDEVTISTQFASNGSLISLLIARDADLEVRRVKRSPLDDSSKKLIENLLGEKQ